MLAKSILQSNQCNQLGSERLKLLSVLELACLPTLWQLFDQQMQPCLSVMWLLENASASGINSKTQSLTVKKKRGGGNNHKACSFKSERIHLYLKNKN